MRTFKFMIIREMEKLFQADVPGYKADEQAEIILNELDEITFLCSGISISDIQLKIEDEVFMPDKSYVILNSNDEPEGYEVHWPIKKYFERYAGYSKLILETQDNKELCKIDLVVNPSKMSREQYEQTVKEITHLHKGLIFDIFGRSRVKRGILQKNRVWVPEEYLVKATETIRRLEKLLHAIIHSPVTGFERAQENYSIDYGNALSVQDYLCICSQPTALAPATYAEFRTFSVNNKRVRITSLSRTIVKPSVDIYEHQAIRWFLIKIRTDLKKVEELIKEEIKERINNKFWKRGNWWEEEDKPRIEQLDKRAREVDNLTTKIDLICQTHPIIKQVGAFKPPIKRTPVFTYYGRYRSIYELMKWAEMDQEAVFEATHSEYLRMKNLAQLYEYWCVLEVLSILSARFESTELLNLVDEEKYVIKLRSGGSGLFKTEDNLWLRFRYEPKYYVEGASVSTYGSISHYELWPDMSIEVFSNLEQSKPDQIIILECKYRKKWNGEPRDEDMNKIRLYKDNIGGFDDYISLVRHAWIIYPSERFELIVEPAMFLTKSIRKSLGALPFLPGTDRNLLQDILERIFWLEGFKLRDNVGPGFLTI